MNIKKPYVDLVNFLEKNQDKKISSILDEIKAMCESQKQASTVVYDKDGKVIAIFCFEHKCWEFLKDHAYGSKKNSTTGYNTMCKVGVSSWTKRQAIAKKAKEELLISVSNGDVAPQDLTSKLALIEEARKLHEVNEDGLQEIELQDGWSFEKPAKQ